MASPLSAERFKMKTFLVLALLAAVPAFGASAYKTDYESVAFDANHQTLGPVGAAGDVLERLVINVTTTGTSRVAITDGASTLPSGDLVIVPVNTPVGSYSIYIGSRSVLGGWRVTTGAGVSVLAVGSFK
jgi:hypothetical protein